MHAWTDRKKNAFSGNKMHGKEIEGRRDYEPWEVGVGELLLAILPPLVPVVIRSVSVRGPSALIFPDVFFTEQKLKKRHHETEIRANFAAGET